MAHAFFAVVVVDVVEILGEVCDDVAFFIMTLLMIHYHFLLLQTCYWWQCQ